MMDQQKLIELLHQQNPEIGERTPFCPDDHEIAAYFDCRHLHSEREISEHHLVNCTYCRARIAVLMQIHKHDADEQIPESLLAMADQYGHQPRRRWRYATAWAAAAVVLTLFTLAGLGPTIGPDRGVQVPFKGPAGEDVGQLRNISRDNEAPTILVPIKGAHVRPEELTIRWTDVPGSLYYDIRLVDAEGFTIWQNRIEETQSRLPEDLNLNSGDQYFVRVDAYLAEAKSISSRHVQIIIEGAN